MELSFTESNIFFAILQDSLPCTEMITFSISRRCRLLFQVINQTLFALQLEFVQAGKLLHIL